MTDGEADDDGAGVCAALPARTVLLADMGPERRHPVNAEPLRGGASRQH